ncbi:hypothetical protein Y032_0276g1091 [Ancylostoma ceylanicum]|uniref:Uncharacterized protein n=1 Tax=Ancylostoma ceylanicum TaxID=53326 RepID=A0A016S8E7_9BILA|nr:hypothetical protein Y032_0276g1091 [Ancylostoma ceylanicum]
MTLDGHVLVYARPALSSVVVPSLPCTGGPTACDDIDGTAKVTDFFITAMPTRSLVALCFANARRSQQLIQRLLVHGVHTPSTSSTSDGLALVLPYVNESLPRQINTIVRKCGPTVRLVLQPPPTLKQLLTSSRIYVAECDQ